MSETTTFTQAVEKIAKGIIPITITEGSVTKVHADSCDVKRDDMPELFKVRLQTVLEPGDNGVLIIPKEGSKVLCGLIENNPTDAFIISASEVETITIHGGNNGGLTITPELVTQLDKLSARVDGIMDALNNALPGTTPDAGAVLLTSIKTALALIVDNEDFSNIENDKITH